MAKKLKPKASENKAKDVEGVKMKLDIKDRLMIANALLPKEGNIITLTLARDIQKKVEFPQAEIKKIGMKTEIDPETKKAGLVWDEKGKKNEFKFTNAECEFLKTQVKDLDNRKKITPGMLSLCLMIRDN